MVRTNKERYNKKYGFPLNTGHSIADIAITTGISQSILNEVAKRGAGAWKNNLSSVRLKSGVKNPDTARYPRSARMTQAQWKFGRIYSFIVGGTTQKTADRDLAIKAGLISKRK
jgi:hypothetical protein